MLEIISRKEAIARGLTRYFTGGACVHGHVAVRNVAGKICNECSRLTLRKWRLNNPTKKRVRKPRTEAQKAKRHSEYERNREIHKARSRKWTLDNPERRAAFHLKWVIENRERVKQYSKDFYKKNRENKEFREYRRKYERRWYFEGPQNPKGERQWLRKNRALLRSVKRYLLNRHPEQSELSHKAT